MIIDKTKVIWVKNRNQNYLHGEEKMNRKSKDRKLPKKTFTHLLLIAPQINFWHITKNVKKDVKRKILSLRLPEQNQDRPST